MFDGKLIPFKEIPIALSHKEQVKKKTYYVLIFFQIRK